MPEHAITHEPGASGPTAMPAAIEERLASRAESRMSWAGIAVALLGLCCAAVVLVRLLESWRVSPHAASGHLTLLGSRLSYPLANADAIAVLALAGLGASVVVLAIAGAIREWRASRGFLRGLIGLRPRRLGGALLIDDDTPRAFCVGLLRPRIVLTTGALKQLDDDAMEAVLAHEAHHARRRDPLRLAVGRVLADAMFFVPGLSTLARRQQQLAELSADESAIATTPNGRPAMARAMLTFADAQRAAGDARPAGVDPLRVDHLLGEPPAWRFPALLFGAAVATVLLITLVAILAGQVARGTATLAPPFLSAQPCIVTLALIPASAALLLASVRRRGRSARGSEEGVAG